MKWNSIYGMKPINSAAAAVSRRYRKKCTPKATAYAERNAERALERAKWARQNSPYWK
ncbi:MAG: hypothetical protein ING66_07370 [Rhodocyclaceae bacterium]|nr:hypothetical protein [Rhodocyclaceae bacterium]MCA3021453.1 hypothetical protein [Rhodocyclaceae bacterium]MCA3028403.1 hypothetical protein [Rhodocyclaceae bacterium]MCA3044006.1 hypothetical protein [Rhodocyclaceae bacterium]MCA3054201.1 hypothetical protein [Rhodocyclaceae bacterium]